MTNVLDPKLLGARAEARQVSQDAPSEGDLRPFGLTQATPLDADEGLLSLDGLTYDPVRQINVDAEGRPAADSPLVPHMGTSYDTGADMQWWTDHD